MTTFLGRIRGLDGSIETGGVERFRVHRGFGRARSGTCWRARGLTGYAALAGRRGLNAHDKVDEWWGNAHAQNASRWNSDTEKRGGRKIRHPSAGGRVFMRRMRRFFV